MEDYYEINSMLKTTNTTVQNRLDVELEAIHTQMAEDKAKYGEEIVKLNHQIRENHDELHDIWINQLRLTVFIVVCYVLTGLLCLGMFLHG